MAARSSRRVSRSPSTEFPAVRGTDGCTRIAALASRCGTRAWPIRSNTASRSRKRCARISSTPPSSQRPRSSFPPGRRRSSPSRSRRRRGKTVDSRGAELSEGTDSSCSGGPSTMPSRCVISRSRLVLNAVRVPPSLRREHNLSKLPPFFEHAIGVAAVLKWDNFVHDWL